MPSSVLTAIGKNETSAITITFGRMSKPVQITRIGAIAGIGTICETTSHGYIARSASSELDSSTARPTPSTIAAA